MNLENERFKDLRIRRLQIRRLKKIKRGFTLIEMVITTVLISMVAYIGTKLTIDYNEQFEWGEVVSTLSSNAINVLDSVENELVQASASSIVLSNPNDLGGYQTIEFPKVIDYNTTSKSAVIDTANTVKFTIECSNDKCSLNKYIVNKTYDPPTVVSGPIPVANNVTSFAVYVISAYVYNISVTVQKTYSDGRRVTSSYTRKVYARNS